MRARTFPLPQAKQLVRCRICPHCPRATPLRSGIRACESDCELFVTLPRVARLLDLRDPMLSSAARTITSVINAGERRGPLREFRGELVPMLVRLAR